MIQTSCPLCQSSHKVPEAQLGKRMRCTDCSANFVVEAEGATQKGPSPAARANRPVPPPPPSTPAPKAKTAVTKRRDEDNDDRPAPRKNGRTAIETRKEPARPVRRPRDEDEEDDRPRGKKKKSGSGGLIIVLLLLLLLLLGGGGAAAYFLLLKDSEKSDSTQASADQKKGDASKKGDESKKGKSADDKDKGKLPDKEEPDSPEDIKDPVLPAIPTSVPPNTPEESSSTETPGTGTDTPGTKTPPGTGTDAPPKGLAGAFALLKDPNNDKVIEGLAALAEAKVDEDQKDAVGRAINPLLNRGGVRTHALKVVKRWTSKVNLPKLIEILNNPFEWRIGVEALSYYKSEEAAEALVKHLPNEVTEISKALQKIGKPAEKAVLTALFHEKGEVRSAAEALLKGYETSDEAKRDQAVTDLLSPVLVTRLNAVEFLQKAKPDKDSLAKAAKPLNGLLAEKGIAIRKATLKCLEMWGSEDHVPTLIEYLDDKDVRKLAIPVLGKIKSEKAIEPLAMKLDTDDVGLIQVALISIGPAVEKPLQEIMKTNPNVKARHAACAVLGEVGTKESIKLLDKLGRGGVLNPLAAATAIKKIKAREKKAALEKDK